MNTVNLTINQTAADCTCAAHIDELQEAVYALEGVTDLLQGADDLQISRKNLFFLLFPIMLQLQTSLNELQSH